MAEGLNKLKLQRGQVKSCLTKVEQWLDENGATAGLGELDSRHNQLKKYESRFESVQTEIEDLDETEFEVDPSEREEFDDRLYACYSKLNEYRNVFETSARLDTSTMQNISLDLVTSDLPKMELPKFSGEYMQYPQFIDTFNALVHNVKSKGMTDVRRFGLLKSCLTGKAQEAIQHLPLVPGNYALALEILNQRFLKTRLIFTSYIKRMWELPKATNSASLRQLSDSYIAIAKGLELIADDGAIVGGLKVHLLTTKCDVKTVEEWEKISAGKDNPPTEKEFLEFLNKRCTQLEGIEYATQKSVKPQTSTPTSSKPTRHANTATSNRNTAPPKSNNGNNNKSTCVICKEAHLIFQCKQFLSETPKGRYHTVKQYQLCVQCLKNPKPHKNCNEVCDKCDQKHNTLLHFEKSPPKQESENKDVNMGNSNGDTATKSTSNVAQLIHEMNFDNTSPVNDVSKPHDDPSCGSYTFLATAIVNVQTVDGNMIPLRALLDSGSQLNLISERANSLLGLRTIPTTYPIQLSGINNASVTLKRRVVVKLKSLVSDYQDTVVLMVHPKLKQVHPSQKMDISQWSLPNDITLADPKFNWPSKIDIVLNAHHVDQYTLAQSRSIGTNFPRLRETTFGWVIVGEVSAASNLKSVSNTGMVMETDMPPEPSLKELLRKFWELESVTPIKILSPEETKIEEHFLRTHTRMPDGRFMVRLPFSRSPELLGESRNIATRRLNMICRKMQNDPEYAASYSQFIDEFISLGHCSLVVKPESKAPHYYIPHFSVKNDNSTTTKTRVVFDASCRTENETSLNELLMVGPKLQDDLLAHLIRFRTYQYVLTGDIAKMYRQILVHPDDRKFQYVLWKKPNEKAIRTYELNTVTYGTGPGSYLAVRSMHQLATTDGDDLPLAKHVLLHHFYMDDMLTGTNHEGALIEVYRQVKELFKRGQMDIRKFQSNSTITMEHIPKEDHGTFLNIGSSEVLKTLGMIWNPNEDCLTYYYEHDVTQKITRRRVLSEISRLFDPLGLAQPVLIRAKLYMQRLYANTVDWDVPLPPEEIEQWNTFRKELSQVSEITLERSTIDTYYPFEDLKFELHGFCDARNVAYAAAIYVRMICRSHAYSESRLLTAKTRVAPLNLESLPRLELFGAKLLSELLTTVKPAIQLDIEKVYLWTDSTITLRWITESPHKWSPYIGTKVTKIQNATNGCEWGHVRSEQNPADLATRGMTPPDVQRSSLWKHGPDFINSVVVPSPQMPDLSEVDAPERAKVVTTLSAVMDTGILTRIKMMSFQSLLAPVMWPKLRRIFGYVHRFVTNLREKRNNIKKKFAMIEDVPQLLNTVIIMIEGWLNSRPLTPLSASPDDGQPLSPAHFLVGTSLRAMPEPSGESAARNKVINAKQMFWRKWSKEYLLTLQKRHKWSSEASGPVLDDLVLLVDKDVAPLKWKLGKIVKLYPGKDNRVRVVDVETEHGIYCRGITEICPVPKYKQ